MLKSKELIRTNVMLDKKILQSIDEFAESLAEDRSTAIRQLLKKALAEENILLAIKRLQAGVPFRKAAETAGLDYWDFQAELDKRGIPLTASLPLAKRRMAAVR